MAASELNYFETFSQVEHVQEQVQSSALKARVQAGDRGHLNVNEYVVSKVFLKWNPSIRAKGFFPVDHSLIPMVKYGCISSARVQSN